MWKSVSEKNGEPSVTMPGTAMMPLLLAEPLDFPLLVSGLLEKYAALGLHFIHIMYAGALAQRSSFYGGGTGAIFLDSLGCDGTEDGLLDCTSSTTPASTCTHNSDASIRCNPARKIVDQ